LTDTTSDFYATATAFKARVDVAVEWSKGAGATEKSVTALVAYQAGIDTPGPVVPPVPEVITTALTVATTDNLKGTAGADTFTGVRSTLSTDSTFTGTDKIDGADGTDTLSVRLDAAFAGFTTGSVKSVEAISLTNTGDVARGFDATGVVGAATYNLDSKTGINLTNVDTLGTINVSNRASGTTTIDFDDTKISTTSSNTLSVGVSGLGAAGTFVGVSAPEIQKMNLSANGASFVDVAGAPLTSLTITGTAPLSVRATGATSLATVDASAHTGGLTATRLVGTLSTLKTGSGNDSVTIGAMAVTASISDAGGTDSLTLDGLAGATYQPAVTGFESVAVANTTGDVIMSLTKSTDMANLSVDALGGDLTMVKSGTNTLTISAKGAQATARTISNDTSGAVTYKTVAADTVVSTTNDANALNLTASKTGTLGIEVAKFTNSTGTFIAASAGSVTLTANGTFNGVVSAARATDMTITAAESVTIGGASNLGALSTLNATMSKNLTLSGITGTALTNVGSLKLTGSGATSALNTGVLGAAANTTAISVTTSGWKGGATIGTVDSQDSMKIDTTANTGNVTIGNIGSGGAAVASLTPAGSTTITSTGSLTNVTVGTINAGAGNSITVTGKDAIGTITTGNLAVANAGTAGTNNPSGSITVDASGTVSASTFGTLTAKTVSVDVSGAIVASTVGAINAITATYVGGTTNTRTDTVNNLTYTGGSGVDTLTITAQDSIAGTASTAASANEEAIALSVSTSSGNDVLAFNMYAGQTKSTVTGKVDLGENTGDADTLTFTDIAAMTVLDLSLLTVAGADAAGVTINATNHTAAATTFGTTGADAITGAAAADTIIGGTGDDTIIGGGGADSLSGGAGADVLTGNTGNDTISGGDGDDTIVSAGGTDSVTGGAGSDTFTTSAAGTMQINDLTTGDIVISTLAKANVTTSSSGVSVFTATAATTNAGGGTVTLTSAAAGSSINLALAGGAYAVNGGAGVDNITGSAGADTITGGAGNDNLTGNGGADTFAVDSGTDTITDLTTTDILTVATGAAASATGVTAFVATAGTVLTGTGTATLNAAAAGSTIDMTLATGGFTLNGGAGVDNITDGPGADTITGGAGADVIVSAAGADVFAYGARTTVSTQTGITVATADSITGFVSGTTFMKLGTAGAAANYGEAVAVADFATAKAAADAAMNGTILYHLTSITAGDGLLFVDSNADGTADAVIVLVGITSAGFALTDIVA